MHFVILKTIRQRAPSLDSRGENEKLRKIDATGNVLICNFLRARRERIGLMQLEYMFESPADKNCYRNCEPRSSHFAATPT